MPHRKPCLFFILAGRAFNVIAMPAQRKFKANRVHEDIEQFWIPGK
jgi:hypothetical protein